MDVINEFNDENEWDLSILVETVQDSIRKNDLDQGLRLARKGLNMSYEFNNEKWIDIFENLINMIKKNTLEKNVENENEIIGENERMQVEGNPTSGVDPSTNQVAKVKKVKNELEMVEGIGPKIVEILNQNNIDSIEKLASMNLRVLQSIKGIGPKSAEKYINAAHTYLEQANLTDYMEEPILINDQDDDSFNEDPDNFQEVDNEGIEVNNIDEFNDDSMFSEDIRKDQENISLPPKSERIQDITNYDVSHVDRQSLGDPSLINEMPGPKQFDNNLRDKRVRPNTPSLSSINAEKINPEDIKKITKDLENDLRSLDYWTLTSKMKNYSELLKSIDLLGIRAIEITDFLEILIIFPMKISRGKGKHRIYDEEIQYVPENKKTTLNRHDKKILIESGADVLIETSEKIFENIINKGVLFEFLKKYLKRELDIEKSMAKKELFLTTGEKYHEVIILPTLIVDNEVEFLESSMAPFAWQRKDNLHVIDSMNVKDYVSYIEKKHVLMETHSTKQDLIDSYISTKDKFFTRMKYFAIPFMIYAGALIFITLFSPSTLPAFIGLGVGLLILFTVGVTFFMVSLLKTQSTLHETFMTPYYKRPVHVDEAGIIMIKEELPEEWMHQFIYECDMNTKDLETVRTFEIEGHVTQMNKEQEIEEIKESKNDEKIRLRPSMAQKYNDFLED